MISLVLQFNNFISLIMSTNLNPEFEKINNEI